MASDLTSAGQVTLYTGSKSDTDSELYWAKPV